MCESRHQSLIPRERFYRRLARRPLVAAILFAPVLHRLPHEFHWSERP